MNYVRHEFASGALTLEQLDGHLAGLAREFVEIMPPKAAEDAPEVGAAPPATEDSAPRDPEMEVRCAWLRQQFRDGMLSRADAVEFERATGAKIIDDENPAPAADSEGLSDRAIIDARVEHLRQQY